MEANIQYIDHSSISVIFVLCFFMHIEKVNVSC